MVRNEYLYEIEFMSFIEINNLTEFSTTFSTIEKFIEQS